MEERDTRVGIDSEPLNLRYGGDQFVSAWRDGSLLNLARKAFPVADEVYGEDPAVWLSSQDAEQLERIVALRHSQRALLLACYDAFAVRARFGQRFADLRSVALLRAINGQIRTFPPEHKPAYLQRWLAILDAYPPDLALIAIHEFERPGRDGYRQRHGIAGASAALRGAPVLAAAHFKKRLPGLIGSSPLAARDVPLTHLWQGTRRRAHRLQPVTGFIEPRSDKLSKLLIRLFVTYAQENIS